MKELFLVTKHAGDYYNYRDAVAVFSSMELAEKFIDSQEDSEEYDTEKFILDELDKPIKHDCPICNDEMKVILKEKPFSPCYEVVCSNVKCYLNKGVGRSYISEEEAIKGWNESFEEK